MSLKRIAAAVKKHKNFLITAHTSLEGDALGSELAFYRLLKKLGKNAVIVNDDEIPGGYTFLPGLDAVKRFNQRMVSAAPYDCFVFLDCSDARRAGEVYRINAENKPVLNIDHHVSNQRFGDVNWIEAKASSCAEMVYQLYKKMRLAFDRDTALFLYVGMLTDTGSFRYPNTTGFTHQAVAELFKYELDISWIYKCIYENIPFKDMQLLARVLPGMHREAKGKIIWCQIKRSRQTYKKLSFDLSEHILSFARSVKGVEVVALFKESPGIKNEVRVNFRSLGHVDVNKIASCFGGGGHKAASGCTVQGKIDQVRRRVLAKIKESLI